MFRNYFTIAWRGLVRQKMYSVIKIGGFAVGIAACLLIALFIRQELTYDLHYPEGERIFRVVRSTEYKGGRSSGVAFPAPFADALAKEFIDLEKVGRFASVKFFGAGDNEFRRSDQLESTHEEGFVFMDQSLIEIFQLPFIYGSSQHALEKPNSIVITKRKASKYFSHEDPIGKTIILNNDNQQYTVTGVIEDIPATSHLQYDFIITLAGREFYAGEQSNWRNSNYPTYVRLSAKANRAEVEKKLSRIVDTYFLPGVVEAGGTDELAWLRSMQFQLQPVTDIYLNLDDVSDDLAHGDLRFIWLFGAIACFILIIASINFINLSTAKSANRAKEVGLRKVVGSNRSSLVRQFLTESIMFSFISFAFGILVARLALPYFNSLVVKPISIPWQEGRLLPWMGLSAIVIGVIAGIYPSLYLSSFKPVDVLKGKLRLGSRRSVTRSVLVVFQFTVSIVLIAGTIIIGRQMDFVLNKKLGYDKEQILLVEGTQGLKEKINLFKDQVLRLPGVKHASISGYLPIEGANRNQNQFFEEGKVKNIAETVGAQRWEVDFDYIETLGLSLIDGRQFSTAIRSDSQALVINRSMATALRIGNPIGKVITNGRGKWSVIGVIEDFHFESMKENIGPLCLQLGPSNNTISVKLAGQDIPAVLEAVAKLWKEFSPYQPMRFSFLDDRYTRMYESVSRMKTIFSIFTILAIVVACLGLFALSVFMVEQRNKEISIRLVLGASVSNIFTLLTSDFMRLVIISLVIAIPAAVYLMQDWLNDYAYRIDLSWDIFALAGFFSITIALVSVSYQSIGAALMNPARNLKSD